MLAVGTDPGYTEGGVGVGGLIFAVALALIGLLLLFAAFRLVKKRRDHHHRYTLPRH